MNHHIDLLSSLGIDESTSPNLVEIQTTTYGIRNPHMHTADPLRKQTYQTIVRHFFEKHLYSAEREQAINGFERSTVTVPALYEDFAKMEQPQINLIMDTNFMKAFDQIQDAFRPRKKIHIVHYADIRLYPWPLRSNIELPFSHSSHTQAYLEQRFEKGEIADRKPCLHNLYDYVFEKIRPIVHDIKEGNAFNHHMRKDHIFPIIAHVRPGLGKKIAGNMKIKNRLTCGVSKIQLFPECMFAYPLFREYLESGLSPLLWGYETINGGWTKLRAELLPALPKTYFVFSGDWSQFDHRVLFLIMNLIFLADMSYYDWTEYQPTEDYPYGNFDSSRLINLYIWLIYATFSSPLLMPDGRTFMRVRNGLPSGMFRTQYIDSKVNGIMLITIFLDAGFTIDAHKMLKLLGDDNLAIIWRWLPPSSRSDLFDFLSERALTRFNAILSVDASEFHDSLDFVELLGYRNFSGKPYRDHLKLLAQLYHPESNSYNLGALKARCIGILYASIDRNPRLRRICEDIFHFLDSQDVNIDPQALRKMFDPNIFFHFDFVTDKIPTQMEIQKWTSSPKPSSPEKHDRYWPTQFFIDPEDTDRRLAALMRRLRFSKENKI